jgi:hypothetical protein
MLAGFVVFNNVAGSDREGRLRYRLFPYAYLQQQLSVVFVAERGLQCAALQV